MYSKMLCTGDIGYCDSKDVLDIINNELMQQMSYASKQKFHENDIVRPNASVTELQLYFMSLGEDRIEARSNALLTLDSPRWTVLGVIENMGKPLYILECDNIAMFLMNEKYMRK